MNYILSVLTIFGGLSIVFQVGFDFAKNENDKNNPPFLLIVGLAVIIAGIKVWP